MVVVWQDLHDSERSFFGWCSEHGRGTWRRQKLDEGMVKTHGGLVGVSSVLVEGCNNGGVVAIVRREVEGAERY